MNVYYFNDQNTAILVRVVGQTSMAIYECSLEPQKGKLFEIDAPDKAIPLIKSWAYPVVLLSYLSFDSELLSHHDEQSD